LSHRLVNVIHRRKLRQMIGAQENSGRQSGTSQFMPVVQTKKKSNIFVASRKDRLYDPVMSHYDPVIPHKAPDGVAIVRAVMLFTVGGAAIWYVLWRIALYVSAKS
jgi:hypothetical protein